MLALGAAADLGLRRRIVLPFGTERFRETSVVDRGEEWGPLYDEAIGAARAANDLVVLKDAGEESDAYSRTNLAILDEAQALAAAGGAPRTVIAVIVWEGAPRGPGDYTAQFQSEAKRRGLDVFEVSTH